MLLFYGDLVGHVTLSPSIFFFGYIINLSVYFSQIVISVIDLNLETFHDKVVSEDTANRCVIKNCLPPQKNSQNRRSCIVKKKEELTSSEEDLTFSSHSPCSLLRPTV